jgi:uncharacterized protein with FMN-binding domain
MNPVAKRILLSVLAVAGVGGLIAVMRYHPSSTAPDATVQPITATSADPSAAATAAPTAASTPTGSSSGQYKDGSYTGTSYDVGYGPVQVQAVISGGRLSNVKLLQMPSDINRSQEIASYAGPQLVQEAISAQSANVDIVSGATQDSLGFKDSLASALTKAKA